MDFHINYELGLRLLISFGIGTTIGLEREYRSKAAGLRTMIMICLGSTIFTEISLAMGGDRIASTIVTGIGFLGAGVIFKDGLTITGLTTATTIWICAALGMAVGAGEYFVAIIGSGVVLIVLIAFEKFQSIMERMHQSRSYKLTFEGLEFEGLLESEIKRLKLGCHRKRDLKDNNLNVSMYEIYGTEKRLDELNAFLKQSTLLKSYEY